MIYKIPNKVLHLTAIPLSSIAAGELRLGGKPDSNHYRRNQMDSTKGKDKTWNISRMRKLALAMLVLA